MSACLCLTYTWRMFYGMIPLLYHTQPEVVSRDNNSLFYANILIILVDCYTYERLASHSLIFCISFRQGICLQYSQACAHNNKNRVNIGLYPACNLIYVLSVSCIYSYMYVCVLIVCTLLLGGNKSIYLSIYLSTCCMSKVFKKFPSGHEAITSC